jgi:enoyl-CoA hydratase/carnithine racemase
MAFFDVVRGDDGVAVATLDKPPANTLDYELYDELTRLLHELAADDAVRVVVFASAHPRLFISGADIKDMEHYDRSPGPVTRKVETVHATFLELQRFPKPTIAVITGHALGGGCEFALCVDFRFMMQGKPTIGQPEVNLGIIPGGGGTQRLARLVGRGRAVEMLMLGTRLDAEEAERIGLVTGVGGDAGETMDLALELARTLASQAPVALRMIKATLNEGLDGDLEEGLVVERKAVIEVLQTRDAEEGVAAFIEKRQPKWEGR